jgi:uncharacterized integral membrane protein (TIGR00698 family)
MLRRIAFVILALLTLAPFVSAATALFAGAAFSLALGNPLEAKTKRLAPLFLQLSIVGLGAGMDLGVVGRVGAQGIAYTAVGILGTLAVGRILGRVLATDGDTSLLLSVGTAICGGSAIAAVAPVIRAKNESVSVALATVFLLNASALLFFPALGHAVGLDQRQFGLFSALAVHDTSSVVGTSMQYGAEALGIATTVKLARALWIVPVTLAVGWLTARRGGGPATGGAKRPWFILGFLLAAALVTWVPATAQAGGLVATVARRSLVLTLFLLGAGLTRTTLKSVGPRPLVQGVALWAIVGSATLGSVLMGWIH